MDREGDESVEIMDRKAIGAGVDMAVSDKWW